MGVALYPLHGRTIENVLRAADSALYRAKQEGRDRVVIAEAAN
jgi:diguanylate cyclase (GGDEF)-like protein